VSQEFRRGRGCAQSLFDERFRRSRIPSNCPRDLVQSARFFFPDAVMQNPDRVRVRKDNAGRNGRPKHENLNQKGETVRCPFRLPATTS